jgi:hypothetical protein
MVKNNLLSAIFMLASLFFISFIEPNNSIEKKADAENISTVIVNDDNVASGLSSSLYEGLKLSQLGLSKEALDYALKGYQKLVDAGAVVNSRYLTIVDFSQSSRKKRFYLLDVKNNKLVHNTFVSHGKNTGIDMAEKFSNKMNSEQSSLGFYVTTATYNGKHGLSLRLSGQEAGINDNAEARGVVVHGAAYVNANRVSSGYMGRSQGCPALPEPEHAKVINIIKDGSVMFIYHPSQNYLQQSSLLKG